MQPTSSESNLAELAPAKRPVVELLSLALPTIAQMASYTVMQFADTLQLAMGAGDAAAEGGRSCAGGWRIRVSRCRHPP